MGFKRPQVRLLSLGPKTRPSRRLGLVFLFAVTELDCGLLNPRGYAVYRKMVKCTFFQAESTDGYCALCA